MSVIIRLQNLPWSANAADIRQYFSGLSIPEGGVHIVGGEKGDAFIAFSTDEDARQAFNRNHGKIKEVQINLLLSSRTEMQKVIEAARSQSMAAFMGSVSQAAAIAPIMPAIVPKATNDFSNKNDRRRSRSRSRSRDRHDRNSKRRDRSRSTSRDRGRRRRSRSRSRTPDRKDRRASDASKDKKTSRVGIWEAPPSNVLPVAANHAVLANLVANNILPNMMIPSNLGSQLANQKPEPFQAVPQRQNSPFISNNNAAFNNGNRPQNVPANNLSANSFHDNSYQYAEDIPPNYCVKMYPFYGGYGDVKKFFSGSAIGSDGILFTTDNFNRRNGQVYVNFLYSENKDEALGRTGDRYKNQIVTIEHVSDEEFRECFLGITNDQNVSESNYVHLKIDALPSYANVQTVRNIFPEYNLASIIFEPKGRFKSAYVKFNNPRDASNALENKDARVFEGKPLRVDVCPDDVFEKVAREFGTGPIQAPSNKVAISGLPLKCSDRDIIDFFSDIGVMPAKINMIANDKGFADQAVCEFYSVDDAVSAFQKNGTHFGNCTVAMKYELNAGNPNLHSNNHNSKPNNVHANLNKPNLQHHANNTNNVHVPSNRPFLQPPNMFPNNRPMFMQNQNMPPPFANRAPNQMRPLHLGPPNMPRGPPMHRFPQNYPNVDQGGGDYMDDEALAPPGCVLLMENVPYKAGVDEILNFLDGYNVIGENVLRKFNPNGLPSGETKVIFHNPDEVFHIVQEKRGCRIRDRPIYLSQI